MVCFSHSTSTSYLFLHFTVQIQKSSDHQLSDFRIFGAKFYQHFRTKSSNDRFSFEQKNVSDEIFERELVPQILIKKQKFEKKFGRRGANKTVRMFDVLSGKVEQQLDQLFQHVGVLPSLKFSKSSSKIHVYMQNPHELFKIFICSWKIFNDLAWQS